MQSNIDLEALHCWLEISQVEEHRLHFPSRFLGVPSFIWQEDTISSVPGRICPTYVVNC